MIGQHPKAKAGTDTMWQKTKGGIVLQSAQGLVDAWKPLIEKLEKMPADKRRTETLSELEGKIRGAYFTVIEHAKERGLDQSALLSSIVCWSKTVAKNTDYDRDTAGFYFRSAVVQNSTAHLECISPRQRPNYIRAISETMSHRIKTFDAVFSVVRSVVKGAKAKELKKDAKDLE
ncbi:unnamed protein product [Vitrella brassicaformis CCMP3155]|uniref:Uncharacterized protein n=1 Tax=Vitrella brassicaformis (strain CCMP3155) TaxID=1169540 RepID=A0A0G4GJ64_VITBC|nr:unnamed protein product [Vitrella brassicaformis CCMP3155]|mmetsp:Transcript_45067/g.111941  ORF Transcript_45067/g.111941 Transcript_45067/m.111941 type:complete len:175 (-) Transcript_45067:50-574(-)|eukprot:CEM29875.1 unnamed protein product [Vitrella brassicaformis CCMP3155]